MYLVESVAPNVSSPLTTDAEVVGSNDTATRFCLIVPCAKRVSVTVGIMVRGFDRVSDVKSAGPILRNTLLTQTQRQTDVRAHPKIPSEGFIPEELNATPMGC
jgi:hypothetical protein